MIGTYVPKRRTYNTRRQIDGQPVEGYFPAIVDRELFDRVQVARQTISTARFKGRSSHEDKGRNLFAGLVWDATNDVPMAFRKASPRSVDFLVSAYKAGAAKHKLPYARFETAIVDHLLKLDWNAIAARRSSASDPSKLVAAKSREVASAKKALELWERKFVANPTEAMLDMYNSLQNRLAHLEGELARLEAENAATVTSNATLTTTNKRGLTTEDRIQLRGYVAARVRQIRLAFGVPRAGWNRIEIELVSGVTVPLR